MIWKILLPRSERTVKLPRALNKDTMRMFVAKVVDEQRDARCSTVNFDFEALDFVEPVGVVVLSNLIEYLGQLKCDVRFIGHTRQTVATKYLDDSRFFVRYLGSQVFANSAIRKSTLPLILVQNAKFQDYLLNTLMPWIAYSVDLASDCIDGVRVSIEEVMQNICDHSGVGIGCSFAQHFPNKRNIQFAISDFGEGIPAVVRRVRGGLDDPAAILQACQEGFTTKSNVKNRGAGLPTLIRYVTCRNGGNVLIAAGNGELSAAPSPGSANGYKITTRYTNAFYPGTLVQVILRTDTLDRGAADVEVEPFSW